MTKRDAIKFIHSNYPNISCQWKSDVGEFRVAYKMLSTRGTIEASAYYTDDIDDAINTAKVMQDKIKG